MKLFSSIKLWAGGLVQRSLASVAANFATGRDLDIQASPGLTEPYRRSAWIRAAIQKVANPIASVELYFSAAEVELDDPALDAFWAAPGLNADGSRLGAYDFIETLAGWLLLKGEYFIILDDTWSVPFPALATRTPLIIARPDRMRHILSDDMLTGWEWTSGNAQRVKLPIERVVHVKMFNPYDDYRGLGPIEAAAIAAGADYASAVFAKNTAEANGDQGMVVVAKGGIPDDAQREQIAAALREKSNLQRRGIFRPLFIGGDVSIEDPKMRSVDAAFVSARLENRKEIAAAFGVPPSFFDPQASYSIGSASDRYVLIEETCRPLAKKICGGLSRVASLQSGTPVCVEMDWDDHSVMQAVRRERVDTGIKLWNTGMPMELVSDYLNLDLPEFPGWEVGYMPFSVSPLGEAPPPTTDPAFAEPDLPAALPPPVGGSPADILQEMRATFAARAIAAPSAPPALPESACTCQLPTDAELATRSDAGLWKHIVAGRRATMAAYRAKFTRALHQARAEVLVKLEHYTPAKALADMATRANPLDFLFNLDRFTTTLQAGFKSVTLDALNDAGKQVMDEINSSTPWNTPDANVLEFTKSRENKISACGENVFESIKRTLQQGIEAGDTRDEIAARIKGEFGGIDDRRARMIAQTETGAAHGYGRHLAITRTNIRRKMWVTSNNQNVRAAHRYMNRYVANVDDPFPVTNPKTGQTDQIMHPGDSDGAGWNVINCHCVEIATEEPLTENPDQAEPIA